MFTIDKRHMDKLLAQQTMCLPQKYVSIFLSGIRYYGIFLLKSQPIRAKNQPVPEGFAAGTAKEALKYANIKPHPKRVQRRLERLYV